MRVPLSSRTLLSFELITDPTPAIFEVAEDNVIPGNPTTPWLVAPRLPDTPPVAPPVAPPAIEVTPPRPPRPCIPALPPAEVIPPALPPAIMLSVSAAVAAAASDSDL